MARPSFPRSLAEFQARFSEEEACARYLAESRWPDGFRCPRCEHQAAYVLPKRWLWQCKGCKRQTSTTAGTVLHRTRVPLMQWFQAAYLVSTITPGLSAVQLQRQLGLGTYETAWTMLHRLRRAMLRPDRDQLTGPVEVDESFIGATRSGKRGRGAAGKVLVVGAVEVRGEGSGRARLAVIPSASQSALEGFVQGHVVEGSTVFTDGWAGYDRLQTLGYHHQPENLGRQAKPSPDPASHPPSLLEPQDVARRDSPRRQLQECPGIPPRVRVPVQPTTDTDGCLSEPAWAHQPPPP